MEMQLALNYSSTDFTGSFNLYNTTTEGPFTWSNTEIARLIQIVVRPILIAVGTFGNGLTIYIMRRNSLKNVSSCFYMSLLALADTGKWVFVFFLRTAKAIALSFFG